MHALMSLPLFSSVRARCRPRFVPGALFVAAWTAAACGGRGPRAGEAPAPVAAAPRNLLLDPDTTLERRAAPDTFDVRFSTTRGPFVVRVVRAWAPRGADRLFYLTTNGFYDGTRFFRVLPRFVAQFGAPGDPRVNRVWESRTIADDPVHRANVRGFVSFATAGPNTRTTQLFVNLANNQRLDRLGFAPLGRVVLGMDNVDSLYAGYGEGAPAGRGPDQDRIAAEGNRYLAAAFPKLDAIDSARVVRAVMAAPGEATAAKPDSAAVDKKPAAKSAAKKKPARTSRGTARTGTP
ncbi:hypothetical protein tb265_08830 [Gemmatimonadetes bacterium T265]|nr:hypothetical protein tb265_08830 [Gemmatimonadetes bacterium T265]